jgi:hypothetical protein
MKKLHYILTVGLALVINACTSEFEEINTNPNRTLVGDIQALNMFEPILYNSANQWLERTQYYNNELIQFTACTGTVTRREHLYFFEDTRDWYGFWNHYAVYGNNVKHMYELAEKEGNPSLMAIALTFKALFFSNMTDMFGDIPYEDAYLATTGGTIAPKFNTQKEVYQFLFADLEAANEIYATNPVFKKPSMDGMYNGNMAAWRKFNNALYLRLLNRVSGRTEMNASEKMTEIMNNPDKYPVFTSNADNATVKFSGTAPYLSNFATSNDGTFSPRKITQQLVKMTVETDGGGNQIYVDPRLPVIAKKSGSSSRWKGTIAGCREDQRSAADAGSSYLNSKVFGRADAPSTYMDYAEVQFIYAEAALNGLIGGGTAAAKSYYEAGVRASMQKWSEQGAFSETPASISDDDIATYLASPLGSWDLAAIKEELLGNQKFLALFWIGMEAYHEYRRTGYPVLTIGEGTTYNDFVLPTRFGYPSTTVSTNRNNVNAALSNMNGSNDMKTPVWWSKQAIGQ